MLMQKLVFVAQTGASIVLYILIGLSIRSEEHTSELQAPCNLVCRLLLGKKKADVLAVALPRRPGGGALGAVLVATARSSRDSAAAGAEHCRLRRYRAPSLLFFF